MKRDHIQVITTLDDETGARSLALEVGNPDWRPVLRLGDSFSPVASSR